MSHYSEKELEERLITLEKFDKAVTEACLKALVPDVEVRITFNTMTEAYTAAKQIAGCFRRLELLDMSKTMRANTSSIELTNGSGILLKVAKT